MMEEDAIDPSVALQDWNRNPTVPKISGVGHDPKYRNDVAAWNVRSRATRWGCGSSAIAEMAPTTHPASRE